MAKKSTYSPVKTVRKVVFRNGNEQMVVALTEGKSGFNTKATVKSLAEDNDEKAKTGCRASFQDRDDADMAFDKLVEETKAAGWAVHSENGRNAFSTIPAPTEKATDKGTKKSRGARK